ncbi:MAG: hypothetical protein KKC68_06620 [Candidatus Thermoplasmatota archaeon]|nr:hypothetical protein [Candidatus Thermoplasmatota archaeon]
MEINTQLQEIIQDLAEEYDIPYHILLNFCIIHSIHYLQKQLKKKHNTFYSTITPEGTLREDKNGDILVLSRRQP